MSCGRSRALAVDFALGVRSLSLSLSLSSLSLPAPLSHEPTRPPTPSILCMRFSFLVGSRRWKSVIERFVRVYNCVRMLRAVCFLLSVQKASCTSAFLCTESQLYVCLPPLYRKPVVRLPSTFLYRKPESYICLTPPCTESQSRTGVCLPPLYRNPESYICLPPLYRNPESYICLPPLYRNPESYVCLPPLYRNPESYVCLPPLYRNPESYVYGASSTPVPHGFFGTGRRGKGMDLFRGVHHRRFDKGGIIVLGHFAAVLPCNTRSSASVFLSSVSFLPSFLLAVCRGAAVGWCCHWPRILLLLPVLVAIDFYPGVLYERSVFVCVVVVVVVVVVCVCVWEREGERERVNVRSNSTWYTVPSVTCFWADLLPGSRG